MHAALFPEYWLVGLVATLPGIRGVLHSEADSPI